MNAALNAVRSGEMGYQKASLVYSVPRSTLRDRVKNKNKNVKEANKGYGRSTTLHPDLENELCSHILKLEEMMFGLTPIDVRKLALQLAVKNGMKHPFIVEKGEAGEDWLKGFMKRHPNISLRTPEATLRGQSSRI